LISFYGDNMQWMVPRYLEHMMTAFSTNQDRMRQTMQETFGGMFPFGNLDEMGKQNMALFESAVKAFSPFTAETGAQGTAETGAQGTAETGAQGTADDQNSKPAASEADTLEKLKEQVDLLQKQLESLSTQQRSAQEGERD
jgi:polyhydroxyalkanoate synthesis regulator protein